MGEGGGRGWGWVVWIEYCCLLFAFARSSFFLHKFDSNIEHRFILFHNINESAVVEFYMSLRMTEPKHLTCAPNGVSKTAWASAQCDQSLRYLKEDPLCPKLPIDLTEKTLV